MNFDFSDEKGKWLIILLVFMMVILIGNIFSNIQQIGISIDYENGEYLRSSRINGSEFLHKLLFFSTAAIYLAIIIMFSVWIHGMVARVTKMNLNHFFISPGKALASIYIPGVNLFRPVEYTKEVYKAVAPMPLTDPKKVWIYNRSSSLPELVWITFILGSVLSLYGSLSSVTAFLVEDYILFKILAILGFVFILTGAFLLSKLVLTISNNIDKKEEEIEEYIAMQEPEPTPVPAE